MISDVYYPRVNGVSTSIRTFRRELHRLGHEVTLVAPDYGSEQADEPPMRRVPARRVIGDPEDRMMRRRPLNRLTGELANEPFDIVHIQTPFVAHYVGLEMARRLGVPCVASYHTLFEEYLYHYMPYLPRTLMRWVARRFTRGQCNAVDRLIVPSRPLSDILAGYGVTTTMTVLPTGIPAEHFQTADGQRFRRRFDIPGDRPTLVHIGRIAHEKNIDFLLHALDRVRRQIPHVLLIIAGEGPALDHIKSLAARLRLNGHVQFIGYLARDRDLPDCFCAGDAFVFASRTETQGLVLLEAMALGVPVVSTAFLGTRDILEGGRGALVAEDNIDDFSDKVVRLLNDATLRARLGDEGRRYAAEWSAATLAAQLADLYAELAAPPARRAA
jgi:glycosyltransferase involved in cell wall biosynthesis